MPDYTSINPGPAGSAGKPEPAHGEEGTPSGFSPGMLPPGILPQEVLWHALVTEPDTGVGIIALDGQILYINEQAARIFHGPGARAADYVGTNISQHHPPEWVEERLRLFQHILQTGKPVLLRTIWRGFQQHTWIHHVDADGPETVDEDGTVGPPNPVRFLAITRRVGSDEEKEELSNSKYEFVESEVADLGPLQVLTARELEVLSLIGQGMTLKEIATVLHRSFKTIDNHRQMIGQKLKADDRVQLADVARRAGLTLRDAERLRISDPPPRS